MPVDGEPVFPEAIFRWTLRLFGIGVLVLIVLGIAETDFGDPPLLHALVGGYILFGMILIPTVVFTLYFIVVSSLAIVALVKVLRTKLEATGLAPHILRDRISFHILSLARTGNRDADPAQFFFHCEANECSNRHVVLIRCEPNGFKQRRSPSRDSRSGAFRI
jgi:uncharacterized membrane protein